MESNHPSWKAGDYFGSNLPFTTIQVVDAQKASMRNLTKYLKNKEELSWGIGVLGMPGSTAYGLVDLMDLKPKDRIWISSATGAVSSIAGQLAKNVHKCLFVLGSAGSDSKCASAKELFAYDCCINYTKFKTADELAKEIGKQTGGAGIDAYLENVGGAHFTAAMENLNDHGRVAVCGCISNYNELDAAGVNASFNVTKLLYKQQRILGFLCHDWLTGKRGNFLEDMHSYIRDGRVKNIEERRFVSIESWPEAFLSLFETGNPHLGKVVVDVSGN